ncbi:unnamed protein product [Aphanomyces euteiches]
MRVLLALAAALIAVTAASSPNRELRAASGRGGDLSEHLYPHPKGQRTPREEVRAPSPPRDRSPKKYRSINEIVSRPKSPPRRDQSNLPPKKRDSFRYGSSSYQ